MTPYERVFNRIEGKPVDKIPNLNIIMSFAAKYINVKYSEYVKDHRLLVDANIKCCNDFGIDMLSAISDSCRELSDFGADIIFPDDAAPMCKNNFIKEYADLKKLKVHDPASSNRMYDRLKAIELYNEKARGYYPVLGWIEGAFAEAVGLRGMHNIMMDLTDEPDFILELLNICTEQAILFAKEQIKAGAHIIGIGDAAASLVGPFFYNKFVLPKEQEIIKAIHECGSKVKLHICGNITSILEHVILSGADMIDIDWMVDFERSVKVFGIQAAACGNFDPVKIMLSGTTRDVDQAVRHCVKVGTSNTFIAAGCEIPRNTPFENMVQVDQTLKKIS
jgi:MtaA/CmuA family methyltransferase